MYILHSFWNLDAEQRHTVLQDLSHIEKYIADEITSLCEKRDISKHRLSQLPGISQSSLRES